MSKRKEGDLRLLKDGVVFGPTDREGLERLLASGRMTLADYVSVRNADWIMIAEYLAAPAGPPTSKPLPVSNVAAATASSRKGDLRVLSGDRVISSLARSDVERLHSAGRIGDDDLICALHGPWMQVGDFLSPPPVETPAPVEAAVPSPQPVPAQVVPPTPVVVPSVPTAPLQVRPVPPPVAPPITFSPAQHPAPQPVGPPAVSGYRVLANRPPAPPSTDEWYVRVRGMHSASLRKHHVKALYQAREITLECLARHGSWHDNDWRPIHSIPQLADISTNRY